MFVKNRTSSVQRWIRMISVLVPGACVAFVLGACTDDTSSPVAVRGRIRDQIGAIREVTGSFDRSALEQVPADAAADLAGCVQIRFCSTSVSVDDAHETLCDTEDPAPAPSAGRCNGDARAVCGQNRMIKLDPAIPCPIVGVPASFCGRGESLVWIDFH